MAPSVSQVTAAALLAIAECLFPEGKEMPKAVAKLGAAAELTNELAVNAKDAIDSLWMAQRAAAEPRSSWRRARPCRLGLRFFVCTGPQTLGLRRAVGVAPPQPECGKGVA